MTAIVHIVDDDASFRTAVGRLLGAAGYAPVMYADGAEFLEKFSDEQGPSCILLDVRIPGLDGPELQKRLNAQRSTAAVVFLTGHVDIDVSVQTIKAGAEDFLTKPIHKGRLFAAIERAIRRSREAHRKLAQDTSLRSLIGTLTPREREVFGWVVKGTLNKKIAHILGTSERTIKAHRKQVMMKTGAKSIAELVTMAEKLGIRQEF
jgi:FixJ family two-component response regulator